MNFDTFAVGAEYSSAIPPQDGAIFELAVDGTMRLLIQMRNPSTSEETALSAGFSGYSLYRSPT